MMSEEDPLAPRPGDMEIVPCIMKLEVQPEIYLDNFGLPVHPPKNILSDNNSHKKSKSLSIKHKRGVISRSDDIVNSIQNVHKRIESCKECFVVLDRLPMQSENASISSKSQNCETLLLSDDKRRRRSLIKQKRLSSNLKRKKLNETSIAENVEEGFDADSLAYMKSCFVLLEKISVPLKDGENYNSIPGSRNLRCQSKPVYNITPSGIIDCLQKDVASAKNKRRASCAKAADTNNNSSFSITSKRSNMKRKIGSSKNRQTPKKTVTFSPVKSLRNLLDVEEVQTLPSVNDSNPKSKFPHISILQSKSKKEMSKNKKELSKKRTDGSVKNVKLRSLSNLKGEDSFFGDSITGMKQCKVLVERLPVDEYSS